MTTPFTLKDFDFHLPPELIAQHPTAQRSASRLLDGRASAPADRIFHELPQLLHPGDLLVFNDTRVIKARLLGHKDSGGAVEALVERVLEGNEVLAHVRASKSPKAGSVLQFHMSTAGNAAVQGGANFSAEVLGRGNDRSDAHGDAPFAQADLFHLRFPSDPFALLEKYGHVPLPPYINHADSEEDERRYQTVFAAKPGAVAAPTAALHFDDALLAQLQAHGVNLSHITLHVGAGTFQPVRTENLNEHRMHSEWFDVPQSTVDAIAQTKARGRRVVAVGTTTTRALESAAQALPGHLQAGSRDTQIFITPGFEFQVVDALITNFHLPASTLIMLVSAFAGHAHVMSLYQHAIAQRYRFFSYGDAMLLERNPQASSGKR